MIVYGSTMSPFVRKVMAFAAEKGIAPELKAAGMGRGGPDFMEASPFGKMPALRDPGADEGRDFCISDSTAIVSYLEAKIPDPALIPNAPVSRARTIWYDEFADTILFGAAVPIFFNRLTLADIAVASPFVNLAHVGVTIDAARWPKTAAYVAAILGRPSFAAMIAAERAMIATLG